MDQARFDYLNNKVVTAPQTVTDAERAELQLWGKQTGIISMYKNTVGRAPSDDELNYWSSYTPNYSDPTTYAVNIIGKSQEALNYKRTGVAASPTPTPAPAPAPSPAPTPPPPSAATSPTPPPNSAASQATAPTTTPAPRAPAPAPYTPPAATTEVAPTYEKNAQGVELSPGYIASVNTELAKAPAGSAAASNLQSYLTPASQALKPTNTNYNPGLNTTLNAQDIVNLYSSRGLGTPDQAAIDMWLRDQANGQEISHQIGTSPTAAADLAKDKELHPERYANGAGGVGTNSTIPPSAVVHPPSTSVPTPSTSTPPPLQIPQIQTGGLIGGVNTPPSQVPQTPSIPGQGIPSQGTNTGGTIGGTPGTSVVGGPGSTGIYPAPVPSQGAATGAPLPNIGNPLGSPPAVANGLLGASTEYQNFQNTSPVKAADVATSTPINTATPAPVAATGYNATNAAATPVAPVSTFATPVASAVKATAQGYTASPLTVSPDATAAHQLAKITGKGSELDQQSETAANQMSNAKGLLNSSMAVGAAHEAVLKNATPLALQDANTYASAGTFNATAENRAREFGAGASNTAELTNAQLGTSTNLTNAAEANKAAEFGAAANNQAGLLGAQLGTSVSQGNAAAATSASQFGAQSANTAALASADNTLKAKLADIQANVSLSTADKQFASQRAIADAANANNLLISKGDNATKTILESMDNASKLSLATIDTNTKVAIANLDAAVRTNLEAMAEQNKMLLQTSTSAASMYTQYVSAIANIQLSDKMDGQGKANAINTQVDYLRAGLATIKDVTSQDLGKYFPYVQYYQPEPPTPPGGWPDTGTYGAGIG